MISRVSFFLFLPLLAQAVSCNSAGDFKGGIGVTRNDSDDDDDGEDDENDTADEPVEVSGAFLTCAFMEAKSQVVAVAKEQPQSSLDIACGLFRQTGNAFGPVDDSSLKLQTRILTNEGKLIPAEFRRLPIGTQMQHITTVPVKHLSGTIHVDYYDPVTAKYSSRRKSIPSITEFSARAQYNVDNDMSVRRFVSGEFPLDGAPDDKDLVPPEDSAPWWIEVIEIIKVVFGPAATVPASYDNGATAYQPKEQVQQPSKKPNTQSGNFPIDQPNKPAVGETPTKPTTTTNTSDKLDNSTVATKPVPTVDPYVKVDMSKQKPEAEIKPVEPTKQEGVKPADPAPTPTSHTGTGTTTTTGSESTNGAIPTNRE
jgi:hypothetical protein